MKAKDRRHADPIKRVLRLKPFGNDNTFVLTVEPRIARMDSYGSFAGPYEAMREVARGVVALTGWTFVDEMTEATP